MIYNNPDGSLCFPPQKGKLLTWAKGKELTPVLADLPLEQGRLRFYYHGENLDQAVLEYDLGDEVAYFQLQVKALVVIEKPYDWESIEGGGITQEPLPDEPENPRKIRAYRPKPRKERTPKDPSMQKGAFFKKGKWSSQATIKEVTPGKPIKFRSVYLGTFRTEGEAIKAHQDFWARRKANETNPRLPRLEPIGAPF